jgi:hypothetical protein
MGLNWWEDSDVIGQWWSYMRFVGGMPYPWNMSVTSFSRCLGGDFTPSASFALFEEKLFMT